MTTKTSLKYASNAHSGGIMENHSPAALLDMLAEVASQTLHSEKNHSNAMFVSSQYTSKSDAVKKKPHDLLFNAAQLLSMPASQLVKQFSIFTSDELKRQYSYTCALVIGCGQKYTSFASEGKARMSIKAHLAEHLQYLKTNKEAYNNFSAKSIISKSNKLNIQTKKNKLLNFKKPQEAVNKENKNIVAAKPSNYLRNILLQDGSFKGVQKDSHFERRSNLKTLLNPQKEDSTYKVEHKVFGDHSYFERLKDELPSIKQQVSNSDIVESTPPSDNIVFMVVGTDSVHTREYSPCNQDEPKTTCVSNVFLSEVPWSEETASKSSDIISTKPKGKAKFIGTSKEEREMALAFMDRIKKRGNPTGSNLECRICKPPRTFTAPTTLVSHYRSHAGIKPYECRICSAVFTRRHSLKYHMLIHQNQTRFTCADCGKKFRHPSHFREHRRRHTGEAPFGCDDCGQRFKTRNTYKRHLKTRHGKVLTTTGELLHLSEEDFEKVKTNRKKKAESNKEQHILNQEIIISQKDPGYKVNVDEELTSVSSNEKCRAHTCFVTDNGSMIDARKENVEAYEICIESQSLKTETIETDMRGNKTMFDTNVNNIEHSCFVKVEDALDEMENSCYNDSLEIVQVQEAETLSHERTGSPTLVFGTVDEVTPYVQYNIAMNSTIADSVEDCQGNSVISMGEVEHHVEIVEGKEKDYTLVTVGQHAEDTDIEYRESAPESDQVPVTMISTTEQHTEEDSPIIMRINVDNSEIDTIVENVDGNRPLTKDDGALMNIGGIAEHVDVLQLLSRRISNTQPKITNTLRRAAHNTDMRKGKEVICPGTPPQQTNNHDEHRNGLKVMHPKTKQIALPLWPAQEISIKNVNKIGKQSAILLLSNDVLKNRILSIGENVTAISTDKLSID